MATLTFKLPRHLHIISWSGLLSLPPFSLMHHHLLLLRDSPRSIYLALRSIKNEDFYTHTYSLHIFAIPQTKAAYAFFLTDPSLPQCFMAAIVTGNVQTRYMYTNCCWLDCTGGNRSSRCSRRIEAFLPVATPHGHIKPWQSFPRVCTKHTG